MVSLRRTQGSCHRVARAAFSPDGHFVAAVSVHGVLHVWTADGVDHLRLPHDTVLSDFDCAPDSERVVVIGADGILRVWPLTDDRIAALAQEERERARKPIGR